MEIEWDEMEWKLFVALGVELAAREKNCHAVIIITPFFFFFAFPPPFA